MIKMINKHKFLKESRKLGIRENDAVILYTSFELMLDILDRRRMNWKKLSTEEWDAIIEVEETSQWPILQNFLNTSHEIYAGVDEKKKEDSIKFQKSILEEMELRKDKNITKSDYISKLRQLIEQRFDYLMTIFEVDKTSLFKTLAIAAAIAGAAAGTTLFVLGKIRKKEEPNGEKKKEDKK